MYTSTLQYVNSCEVCQHTKSSTRSKKAPLKPLPIVGPFQRVHIDHVGPLNVTKNGNRHLLVIIDSFSGWPEAFPTKSTSAEEVADILYREIISRYGMFDQLVTDQARSFRNKLVEQLCKLLKIKHVFSSPYHAQSNGQVERCNQTLVKSLRLICDKQEQWDDFIAPVLFSYRATVTVSTNISPYRVLFGREMKTAIDSALLAEWEGTANVERYTGELIPKLKLTEEITRQNLQERNEKAKLYYDRNTTDSSFSLGEKVLLYDSTTKSNECRKLKRRWVGPFLLTDRSDDGLTYRLKDCQTGKERRAMVHFNRLKRYNDDRDDFYERCATIPDAKVDDGQQTVDTQVSTDEWYSIKKVTAHKKVKGKDYFQVVWEDDTRQWLPSEDVTEFAKNQYYVNRRQKRRRKRRG